MTTSGITSQKEKRGGSGLLSLVVVIVIVAIIAISFGRNILSLGTPAGVPEKLAEMKLGSFVEGDEAMAQVNQLHGTRIQLTNAYIAEYSHDFNPYHNNDARATVWVGTAESSDAAAALLTRMVEGISNGNPVFSNLQRLTINGDDVYEVRGADGEHFFYQSRKSGERIVWLTVQSSNVMPIVEEAVKNF